MSKKNIEDILIELDKILRQRKDQMPNDSYIRGEIVTLTRKLLKKPMNI